MEIPPFVSVSGNFNSSSSVEYFEYYILISDMECMLHFVIDLLILSMLRWNPVSQCTWTDILYECHYD